MKVNGHRIQIQGTKNCLSTNNQQTKDDTTLVWWGCHGFKTQKWIRINDFSPYDDLCKDKKIEGKRYRVCPGKANKFLGESCKNQVEVRNKKEILVKKCGSKTWDVHSCHRVKESGQWYRVCGKNHRETVTSDKIGTN